MDIYSYLKKDHKAVSKLLEEVVNSDSAVTRLQLFKEIYTELTLHAKAEQKTFYKAINKTKKNKEEISHAKDEHKEIENVLNKLIKTDASEYLWLIHFGELKSIVEHHVKEEETEIFPMAKKVISKTRAQSLVEEMEMEKQKLIDNDKVDF